MDFVAIDFETATGYRDSACSVAVVEIKGGELVDSYYTLIQPPGNKYYFFNTKIHGITPADTEEALPFACIWEELVSHLAGRLVVAHNACFDMGVLAACLTRAGLTAPEFSYCDTVAISRRLWPELANHKLDTVGEFLKVDFHHHNALDDARACAAIPIRAGEELGIGELEHLAKKIGVAITPFALARPRRRRGYYPRGGSKK